MAKIEAFQQRDPKRTSIHGEVEATFHVFEDAGETFLQIDTYGAPGRPVHKVSQSLQLGKSGRAAILKLLLELKDK